MRRAHRLSLNLMKLAIALGCLLGVMAGVAHADSDAGVELVRSVGSRTVAPGETVVIQLEVVNRASDDIGYTLIEEIPADVTLLDQGRGSYNRSAGFVVWRSELAGGAREILRYSVRVDESALGIIPLYAYVNTTAGAVLELADQLEVVQIPWQLTVSETLVHVGNSTALSVRLQNPFDRAIEVGLTVEARDGLKFNPNLPGSVALGAGESITLESELSAASTGSFAVRMTPEISGVAAGRSGQATLTFYEGEAPRAPKETVANDDDRRPVTTERVHDVRIPARALSDGEELLFVARIPSGAGYLPGTVAVGDDASVTPRLNGEYLMIPLPSVERTTVRYALRHQDRSTVADEDKDLDGVAGVIALGLSPRLLVGGQDLLYALHGESIPEPRPRVGAVILSPFDGQVYTDRERIDVEVDAPSGSHMTLKVNGEAIPRSQIGGVAQEPSRLAEKYIAVPLNIGSNRIELEAETPDGEILQDSVTVYRSGPVTQLDLFPLSDLVTGRVQPLLVQVVASDENGLAPADRTPVTVSIEGARILSQDAHPDWVGHQVLLYGGRALLEIEPPAEATTLMITARSAAAETSSQFVVSARADQWFLISLGTARISGMTGDDHALSVESALRLVARGPLRGGVFTAAIDTRPDPPTTAANDLWTGDTSSQGFLVGGGEPIHLQYERGLSYVRYGAGRVDFAGELAGYGRTHGGIQALIESSPRYSLRVFADNEPTDMFEEVLDGDGTGYYRLANEDIDPGSEEITVLVRDRSFPHAVLSERRLRRNEYTLDYSTGQIWLREPLLSRDDEGNRLSMRVRYGLLGERSYLGVGGVQGTLGWARGFVRGTARLARDAFGDPTALMVLGGEIRLPGQTVLTLETGIARGESSTGTSHAIELSYPSLWGWKVRLSHRDVDETFARSVDNLERGKVTSFSAEGRVRGVRLSTQAAVKQDETGWTDESSVKAEWSWGRFRPNLGLVVRDAVTQPDTSLNAGVAFTTRFGSIDANREVPILGDSIVRDQLEGRLNLPWGIDALVGIEREDDGKGEVDIRHALSLTKSLEGRGMSTVFRGAYESPSGNSESGSMVYSATTRWPVNDANSVEFTVDHRRPLGVDALPSFGGALGWMHRHHGGDTEFRIDRRGDKQGVKQSLQLRRFQQVSDDFAIRVDGFASWDAHAETRVRLSLNAAYRTERSAVLGSYAMDQSEGPWGERRSAEWRLKAVHRMSPELSINVGYAARTTEMPTHTQKVGIGVTWRLSDQMDLIFEGSTLWQRETQTSLQGSMLGLGLHLNEDLGLIFGYAMKDYVGFDMAGPGFERRRAGAFVEVNVAFDELSLGRWFGRR